MCSTAMAFYEWNILSGEFDELISALVTGDVFGDDIAKLKKTRRKPPPQNQKGIFDAPRERAIKAS